MKEFKCYWCAKEWSTLSEVISHTTISHADKCIKYQEFGVDETTGKTGYRTRILPNVIPNKVRSQQKHITVKDEIVFITHIKDDKQQIVVTTPMKGKDFQITKTTEHIQSKYVCVYCIFFTDSLSDIVSHSCEHHEDSVLKYREYTPSAHKPMYMSKLHEGIIPANVKRAGSELIVKNKCMVLIREKKSNHQKLNTPLKTSRADSGSRAEDDVNDSLDDQTMNTEEASNEMQRLLPTILNTLYKSGKLESYMKFNRLIHEQKLPMDNICYLLFNDLVEWFSSSNTSQMRYRKETVQFWQLGYRFFHGKFLRFMAGLRNFGQVLDEEGKTGDLNPGESRINFAVSALKNLYRKDEHPQPIYPGILEHVIENLSAVFEGKPAKLCVDGKKISRGAGKKMGDIDCWGYESSPSLAEKQKQHKHHVDSIKNMQSRIDQQVQGGLSTLDQLASDDKSTLSKDLLNEISNIAEKNKLLREKAEYLEKVENKLKMMGGKTWMTSKYYPAICSIRVNRSNVLSQLEESLKLTDKLAFYAATLNGKQGDFETSNKLAVHEQANYFQLNENYETEESRYIKQRTDKWMGFRNEALVTGSTCNRALGLGLLRDQQHHYDGVILKKEKPELSDEIKERMRYGVLHEEDAIATVCGKVLPAFYPETNMYEEGCVKVSYNGLDSFMVVSPDGSLRTEINESSTVLAYETKCKSPTSYSHNAYYKIPLYYIPQLICEMRACDCDRLLFTCWSESSMTVFEVTNDRCLWDKCWTELTSVYAGESISRPKHFSECSKELKEDVKQFAKTNTKLIGEFQSLTKRDGSQSTPQMVDKSSAYVTSGKRVRQEILIDLTVVQDLLGVLTKWCIDTFECLRSIASEILVFMVSDLDRVFDMESQNAHIIAYAMKGPSMRNDVLRKMMHDVIRTCEKHGLNIVVTSSDGQWHLYGVTDDEQEPLTVHQLKKKVWNSLKSQDKSKLQARLRAIPGIDNDLIMYETNESGKTNDKNQDKNTDESNEHAKDPFDGEANDVCYFGCITENLEETVSPETVEAIDRALDVEQYTEEHLENVFSVPTKALYQEMYSDLLDLDLQEMQTEPNTSSPYNNQVQDGGFLGLLLRDDSEWNTTHIGTSDDTSFLLSEASRVLHQEDCSLIEFYAETYAHDTGNKRTVNDQTNDPSVREQNNLFFVEPTETDMNLADTSSQIEHETELPVIKKLNGDAFAAMLNELRNDTKLKEIHKWHDVSLDTFINYFTSKEEMNKHLQKPEVFVCAKFIERTYTDAGLNILKSWPKYRILNALFEVTDKVDIEPPKKKRKTDSEVNKLKLLNKDDLMKILAEKIWDDEFEKWRNNSPVPNCITVSDVCESMQWFSRPSVDGTGAIRFHFTDACHLLTCLRTKICTSGIEGLQRKAWEVAALSKATKLNISVVVDCVDKQDVALARRVFAADVEQSMEENGFINEAHFCRLIRQWYDSEDEPAIPATERCKRRYNLLNWLLQGYNVGKFPPATRYVKGIPIVTFEALVCHLERKIQLYGFVPSSKYNARACGTQEVEQLFSTFRDMDPAGSGTVKPDTIPGVLASAVEIDNYRLLPDRPFYIKTSSAAVYPSHSLDKPGNDSEDIESSFIRNVKDSFNLKEINPCDHHFDSPARDQRSHNRASGMISLPRVPAHGEQGVRQYHRRDDSKIPAHRRLGFMELPDV